MGCCGCSLVHPGSSAASGSRSGIYDDSDANRRVALGRVHGNVRWITSHEEPGCITSTHFFEISTNPYRFKDPVSVQGILLDAKRSEEAFSGQRIASGWFEEKFLLIRDRRGKLYRVAIEHFNGKFQSTRKKIRKIDKKFSGKELVGKEFRAIVRRRMAIGLQEELLKIDQPDERHTMLWPFCEAAVEDCVVDEEFSSVNVHLQSLRKAYLRFPLPKAYLSRALGLMDQTKLREYKERCVRVFNACLRDTFLSSEERETAAKLLTQYYCCEKLIKDGSANSLTFSEESPCKKGQYISPQESGISSAHIYLLVRKSKGDLLCFLLRNPLPSRPSNNFHLAEQSSVGGFFLQTKGSSIARAFPVRVFLLASERFISDRCWMEYERESWASASHSRSFQTKLDEFTSRCQLFHAAAIEERPHMIIRDGKPERKIETVGYCFFKEGFESLSKKIFKEQSLAISGVMSLNDRFRYMDEVTGLFVRAHKAGVLLGGVSIDQLLVREDGLLVLAQSPQIMVRSPYLYQAQIDLRDHTISPELAVRLVALAEDEASLASSSQTISDYAATSGGLSAAASGALSSAAVPSDLDPHALLLQKLVKKYRRYKQMVGANSSLGISSLSSNLKSCVSDNPSQNDLIRRDQADDIWTLGCVLFSLLTVGKTPLFLVDRIGNAPNDEATFLRLEKFQGRRIDFQEIFGTQAQALTSSPEQLQSKLLEFSIYLCFQPALFRPNACQLLYLMKMGMALLNTTKPECQSHRRKFEELLHSIDYKKDTFDPRFFFLSMMKLLQYSENDLAATTQFSKTLFPLSKDAIDEGKACVDDYRESEEEKEKKGRIGPELTASGAASRDSGIEQQTKGVEDKMVDHDVEKTLRDLDMASVDELQELFAQDVAVESSFDKEEEFASGKKRSQRKFPVREKEENILQSNTFASLPKINLFRLLQ